MTGAAVTDSYAGGGWPRGDALCDAVQDDREGIAVAKQAVARIVSRQQVEDDATAALREVRRAHMRPLTVTAACSTMRHEEAKVLVSDS